MPTFFLEKRRFPKLFSNIGSRIFFLEKRRFPKLFFHIGSQSFLYEKRRFPKLCFNIGSQSFFMKNVGSQNCVSTSDPKAFSWKTSVPKTVFPHRFPKLFLKKPRFPKFSFLVSPSDFGLQTVKLKWFWATDRQTQTILGCRPSNSSDFGLQTVKLKRFCATDCQTQANLGCRPSNSSGFGLQTVQLKRFGVADHQTQAILVCRLSNSNGFGLQAVKLKRFGVAETNCLGNNDPDPGKTPRTPKMGSAAWRSL